MAELKADKNINPPTQSFQKLIAKSLPWFLPAAIIAAACSYLTVSNLCILCGSSIGKNEAFIPFGPVSLLVALFYIPLISYWKISKSAVQVIVLTLFGYAFIISAIVFLFFIIDKIKYPV